MIRQGLQIVGTAVGAWGVALALAFAAQHVVVLEAQKGKPLPEVSVTVSFGTGALHGDSLGDYVNGSRNVLAVVYPSGNLGLNMQADTRKPAERSVCLDFGIQPVPETLATALATDPCFSIGSSAGPYVVSDRIPIQSMKNGDEIDASAWFGWQVAGQSGTSTHYRLWYGGNVDGDSYLDTLPLKVNCIAGGTLPGQCTQWTVATQANGAATLQSSVTTIKGGKVSSGPIVQHGPVDMPFMEAVTRQ